MQSPEIAPAQGFKSAAAGLLSRMLTAFSRACTFCACSSDIAATSCAVAGVGARPGCAAAVCVRVPEVVVRAPESDSCFSPLDCEEREPLGGCASVCACPPDWEDDALVEVLLDVS